MKYLILLFAFGIFSSVSAQIDGENHTTNGGGNLFGNNTHIDRAPIRNKKRKNLLGQPDRFTISDGKEDKKVNMRLQEEFVKREVKFDPEYLKGQEERKVRAEYSEHQDLGSFKSDAKFVKISCRDFQAVDGDRVDIILNGKVVVHNVNLVAEFQTFYIDLEKGFNKIDFQALNQGTSGPNTAAFKVVDGSGRLITQNEWNLTTGTKASLIIVKNN